MARTTAINAKMAQLQQLADDLFGRDPDAIHWGHGGDLGRVEAALDELLAMLDGQAKSYKGRRWTSFATSAPLMTARASGSCD